MTTDTHPKEAAGPAGRLVDRRHGQGRRDARARARDHARRAHHRRRPARRALDAALRAATRVTFDRLDSDGCMSTNDTVTLLASGASGITPHAQRVHRGAHRGVPDAGAGAAAGCRGRVPRHHHRGRATRRPRTTPSRSAARSPAATCSRRRSSATTRTGAGCWPSVGTTSAAFDPYGIDVTINGIRVCRAGGPDQPRELVDLTAAGRARAHRPGRRTASTPASSPTTSRTTTCTRTARTRADGRRQLACSDHRGDTIVVKFGGNAMVDDALKRDFAADMVALLRAGIRPVVVHGGGPQISAALQRAGIPSEFRGGYRFTSTEAIQVVHDVLAGEVGGELAALINEHGDYARRARSPARRLSRCSPAGAAASWSTGRRSTSATSATSTRSIPPRRRAAGCRPHPRRLLDRPRRRRIPAAVAQRERRCRRRRRSRSRCGASWLLVLTDVPGLYRDWPDRDSLVSRIDTLELAGAAAHADLRDDSEDDGLPRRGAAAASVTRPSSTARESHALVREPFGVGRHHRRASAALNARRERSRKAEL